MKTNGKNKPLLISTIAVLTVCLCCVAVLVLKTNELNTLSTHITELSTQLQTVEQNNNILIANKKQIKDDFLVWEVDFAEKNPQNKRLLMEIEKYEFLANKAKEVLENE